MNNKTPPPQFVRRCHHCGETNFRPHSLEKKIACSGCNRSLAPFYFFSEFKVPTWSDHEEQQGEVDSPVANIDLMTAKYARPLYGFSAIWPIDES